MSIEDLCSDTPLRGRFDKRFTKDQLNSYVTDLKRLVELEEEGKPMPTLHSLAQFFREEYSMVGVPHSSIRYHINKLKQGQPLWRE